MIIQVALGIILAIGLIFAGLVVLAWLMNLAEDISNWRLARDKRPRKERAYIANYPSWHNPNARPGEPALQPAPVHQTLEQWLAENAKSGE